MTDLPFQRKYLVYKIVCLETNEIYIGSTSKQNYNQRIRQHKNIKNKCTSKKIIDRNNYQIEIIEENIIGGDNVLFRERYFIENTPNIINKCKRPKITREEDKERNRLYAKKKREV